MVYNYILMILKGSIHIESFYLLMPLYIKLLLTLYISLLIWADTFIQYQQVTPYEEYHSAGDPAPFQNEKLVSKTNF